MMRLAIGVAGIDVAGFPAGHVVILRGLQTMYFIISFMSPNSITVLSSVITMRP
jgi:hypothetical protein